MAGARVISHGRQHAEWAERLRADEQRTGPLLQPKKR
jgi:hypothetical protein